MKLTFTKENIDDALKSGCKTVSEFGNFILGEGSHTSLNLLMK